MQLLAGLLRLRLRLREALSEGCLEAVGLMPLIRVTSEVLRRLHAGRRCSCWLSVAALGGLPDASVEGDVAALAKMPQPRATST